MITQLNPTLPVIVTSKDNREGEVFALWVRSPEHYIYHGVIFDDTGEIWWVPNNEVRVMNCWTTGRPPRSKNPTIEEKLQKAADVFKDLEGKELTPGGFTYVSS